MKDLIDLKPRFFNDRNEVHIFIDYLVKLTDAENKMLAESIKNQDISSLVFQCRGKENITYTPKLLYYVDKEKIKKIFCDTSLDFDILKKFNNLNELGLFINDKRKLSLHSFPDLEAITITGYNNNIVFNEYPNIKFVSFWKSKCGKFDYNLDFCGLKKLVFMNYNSVNLNNVSSKNIDILVVDNAKQLIINNDNEILSNLVSLEISNCDLSYLNVGAFEKMKKLSKLVIEKCDLSNITQEVFVTLISLKELILDKCKNLNSINGIPNLDRVVILDTKILDNDITPLNNCKNSYVTKYKTYNKKIW